MTAPVYYSLLIAVIIARYGNCKDITVDTSAAHDDFSFAFTSTGPWQEESNNKVPSIAPSVVSSTSYAATQAVVQYNDTLANVTVSATPPPLAVRTEADVVLNNPDDILIEQTTSGNNTPEILSNTTIYLSEQPNSVVVRPEVRAGSYAAGTYVFLQPSQSAAILAAVFVSVALTAYVALLMWRHVLEKRYGNRELLVNEELYDVNDLKYFEL